MKADEVKAPVLISHSSITLLDSSFSSFFFFFFISRLDLNLLVLDLNNKNVTMIVIKIVNNIDILFVKIVGMYRKSTRIKIYESGIEIYGKNFQKPGISSVVLISKIIR